MKGRKGVSAVVVSTVASQQEATAFLCGVSLTVHKHAWSYVNG